MRTLEARNVLKVGAGASEDEIRRAYRREALRWHPDKNPGDTEAATVSFQHVQAAFLALRKNDAESCKENAFDSERRERRRKACAKVDWAKMREDSQSETSRNSTPVGERN